MTAVLNETHDVNLRSWVASANLAGSDFPLQNLPFGVFRRPGSKQAFRIGVAIGDQILDLAAAHAVHAFAGYTELQGGYFTGAINASSLNGLMGLGAPVWSALRLAISRVLREGSNQMGTLQACLLAQSAAEFALPAQIGDYTDFYTSVHHATAVGKLFRPDQPLLPNYKWVPIGYHGRASSIGISGQQFHRPRAQTKAADAEQPSFGPAKRMDYELEVGIFIGQGNALGTPIALEQAESHVFGLCLLNDWSARDVQAWEYQPLGPFLAKNFASTISPWIVTLEALLPYRQAWTRDAADPQPLPYLESDALRSGGAFDVALEVLLQTETMRADGQPAERLSVSNFKHSYWTVSQLVAHHTVNGCNLNSGDLLGSGTQSGPLPEEAGSLLELSEGGKKTLQLSNGEQRVFLADGDTVIMRAWASKEGCPRIGFGEVRGTLLPAREV
ncbi:MULTISPECIES: fumarylacetoacetase [unclassified Undibacterium]|uniref:fumarylacetoacetase n=1 Tax=unclassified Undibacterium TaxID=2630295 RepID=UPI002AC9E2F2|nr:MULTISPECIES: fumarylacetoacetase [unclassified Undibacterium]MEB0137406.1 fumarylacetoacetase [Undibacterium sp. CCC2.1]MEB0170929.1 fumarylacetoacetase [Undibacterium sp. CCC1.1]MEB0174881.1 fumarylacetoacetase [Undibacterium sp. CCC3.4]MEB0214217.1 fumarylacetoacetase [Undibacterium sp. 5I2]WPX44528.1 fumarylacetoacetase [Undibacterium sp. CCC3.4]